MSRVRAASWRLICHDALDELQATTGFALLAQLAHARLRWRLLRVSVVATSALAPTLSRARPLTARPSRRRSLRRRSHSAAAAARRRDGDPRHLREGVCRARRLLGDHALRAAHRRPLRCAAPPPARSDAARKFAHIAHRSPHTIPQRCRPSWRSSTLPTWPGRTSASSSWPPASAPSPSPPSSTARPSRRRCSSSSAG